MVRPPGITMAACRMGERRSARSPSRCIEPAPPLRPPLLSLHTRRCRLGAADDARRLPRADHDRRDHRHPDRAQLGMRACTQCDITLNQARVPADAVGRRIGAPADLHPGRDGSSPLTGRPACRRQARPQTESAHWDVSPARPRRRGQSCTDAVPERVPRILIGGSSRPTSCSIAMI